MKNCNNPSEQYLLYTKKGFYQLFSLNTVLAWSETGSCVLEGKNYIKLANYDILEQQLLFLSVFYCIEGKKGCENRNSGQQKQKIRY